MTLSKDSVDLHDARSLSDIPADAGEDRYGHPALPPPQQRRVPAGKPRATPEMIDAAIERARKPRLRLVEKDLVFDAQLAELGKRPFPVPPLKRTSENDTYSARLKRYKAPSSPTGERRCYAVNFAVSEGEMESVKRAASHAGVSVSEFARRLILAASSET